MAWDNGGPCPAAGPAQTISWAHQPDRRHSTGSSRGRASIRQVSNKSVTATVFVDGGVLASGGAEDGMVKLWDLRRTEKPLHALSQGFYGPQTRSTGITSIAVDCSGSRLLASTIHGPLMLYDLNNPQRGPVRYYEGHYPHSFYIKACFSPDGTHVASGSGDHKLYVWETDAPAREPYVFEGHHGEVAAVAWSPHRFERLASCADDGTLRVWDIARPAGALRPRRLPPRPAPRAFTPPGPGLDPLQAAGGERPEEDLAKREAKRAPEAERARESRPAVQMRLDDIFRAPRQSGVNVRAPRWGGGQAEAGGAPPADDRYRALPKDRLKEELRGRGLPVSGTKAVLVARLVAHDEAQAAAPPAGDGRGGGA